MYWLFMCNTVRFNFRLDAEADLRIKSIVKGINMQKVYSNVTLVNVSLYCDCFGKQPFSYNVIYVKCNKFIVFNKCY